MQGLRLRVWGAGFRVPGKTRIFVGARITTALYGFRRWFHRVKGL